MRCLASPFNSANESPRPTVTRCRNSGGEAATLDFNLLRLILSLSVVFAHYGEITGHRSGWGLGLSALVAVQAFFFVSGWVVTASYDMSPTLGGFLVRRMARLYPLLVIVVLAQALIVWWMVAAPAIDMREIGRYLAANLTLMNFAKPSLLGFLDGARVAAINPSLWTLKIEVMFYVSVPLIALIVRWNRWAGLAALFFGSTAYLYLVAPLSEELAKQLPGQLRFFIAGMACRMFMVPVPTRSWERIAFAVAGATGLLFAQTFDNSPSLAALQPVFVGAFVVGAAALLPSLGRLPDLSYGVYLLHAPLIQLANERGWLRGDGWDMAALLLVTGLLAWLAHHGVEAPAIRLGRAWSDRLSRASKAGTVPGLPLTASDPAAQRAVR